MNKDYDLHIPVQLNKKSLNLRTLLQPETLFRLNPHWIIENFQQDNGGFKFDLTDHVSGKTSNVEGTLTFNSEHEMSLTVHCDEINSLRLFSQDNKLWAAVEYSHGEIDETTEYYIVMWLRSIKEYLRLYLKNSFNTVIFRYLMNKVILKMTPSQRKISLMLIRITALELLVILIIVIGYYFFMRS